MNSKRILAIGGAVIKTALPELRKFIEADQVEMLIHNGGSLFHDFQIALEPEKLNGKTSIPLDQVVEDHDSAIHSVSKDIWRWILSYSPQSPSESITFLCQSKKIPVLLFTGLGCDFWQLHGNWTWLARQCQWDFEQLCERMKKPFHYVCMGSAVIHPEVFTKALAVAKPKEFRADVVDFLDMYRPRTRVAKFGNYYQMTHKEYLRKELYG